MRVFFIKYIKKEVYDMGFLSSLFSGRSRDKDEDDKLEVEEEEFKKEKKEPAAASLKIAKGMTVNVTLSDGKPLLSGKVEECKGTSLSIERDTGQFAFATCDVGSLVYIRGYGAEGTIPIDVKGTVEVSQSIILKVKDVEVIPYDEHRSNFRLTISAPVSLYYEEDTKMQSPENCKLVNISIGGALVESEYIHTQGEILRMKVQLEDYVPMTFMCQILRVDEPKPGIFRYGVLFAKLDERELTNLTKVLFNIQVGNKRTKMRTGPGNW